jgi:hypothetical protein
VRVGVRVTLEAFKGREQICLQDGEQRVSNAELRGEDGDALQAGEGGGKDVMYARF